MTRMRAVRVMALAALLGTTATLAQAAPAYVDICTARGLSLSERAAKLQADGFTPRKTEDAMWVEGQLIHIALSDLEYGPYLPSDMRETFTRFKQMADADDLFIRNENVIHLTAKARNLSLSLTHLNGETSCAIAFRAPTKGVLKTAQTWTSEAGRFEVYAAPHGASASGSVPSDLWAQWLGQPRAAYRFLIMTAAR